MANIKDRVRETVTRAGELTVETGKKVSDLAQTGAREAVEKGKSLYASLRRDEKAELQELGEQPTLAELSEDQQDQYLRSLLPLLIPFDPPDPSRLRRIYQILTVMGLGQTRRRVFLDELFFSSEPGEGTRAVPLDELTRLSLGKDLLALSGDSPPEALQGKVSCLLGSLQLSRDQIEVLNGWTSWENQMLEKMGRADFKVSEKDLPIEAMKKASAVGVPLGALYLSGSVVGFSAAGISSGLATLGGAAGLTALGLNPMTAGIAALILCGVGVKKLLDAAMPTTEGDQEKKLAAAAHAMEARRNRYLAMLSQDLLSFHRTRPQRLRGERKRLWDQAVGALSDLIESEARVTLGEAPPVVQVART